MYAVQKIPRCQEGLWNITYAASAEEGEADVVITVPRVSEKVCNLIQYFNRLYIVYKCVHTIMWAVAPCIIQLLSVSSILTCEDLVVNGTGKAVLQLNKVIAPLATPMNCDIVLYIYVARSMHLLLCDEY